MSRRRKVELLGCGLSIGDIPSFDPGAERWGLNDLIFRRFAGDFTEWTRWFDLHPTWWIQEKRPAAYDWYRQQTKPIYRLAADPALPSCCVYPRERIQTATEREFAGSLCWMLALAIHEGFDAIDLFWFTLDGTDPFYKIQVDSAKYWIGFARGRGIEVTIHGDSALKPTGPVYGYEIIDGVRV